MCGRAACFRAIRLACPHLEDDRGTSWQKVQCSTPMVSGRGGYVHAWEALTAGRACLPCRDVRSCQASSDATTMGHEPSYDNYCHIMMASTGREKAMRIRLREAPACKSRGHRRIG